NPYDIQNRRDGDGLHSLMINTKTKSGGYKDLVKEEIKFTRMNMGFSSIIDHIYISPGMQKMVEQEIASKYKIPGDKNCKNYGKWRKNYSDHLPIYFDLDITIK